MIHDLTTQKGRNAYTKSLTEQAKFVNKLENYKINIEVRDSEGKIILDENDNKCLSLSYETEMLTSNMEFNLHQLANTLKAFMPDRQINIEVYVHNTISGTYMNMFSFYVSEDRFIKH
jgi:hypothetical protein